MIVPYMYATPRLCMHERMMQPVHVHIGACACVCVCITMRGGTSAPASRNCSVKFMLGVSVLCIIPHVAVGQHIDRARPALDPSDPCVIDPIPAPSLVCQPLFRA